MRLFVDQLTNLDFSYLDAKRGLVGETWLANIELEGELDEQGMVCDFGDVKKNIRNWLDNHIDHKLLIPSTSQSLNRTQHDGQDSIKWTCERGTICTVSPEQAHCFVESEHITQESVAQWCVEQLKALFPSSVKKLHLSFSIESIPGPYYHYSHGLKKHGGNCQRIAHGHRSKIEVWENNALSVETMQDIANEWRDIYIGSEEDCRQDPNITENYVFYYEAQQGPFTLSLPKTHCYLMPTDTTVELIAEHLSIKLKNKDNDAHIRVKAYEGLAKGAISEQ